MVIWFGMYNGRDVQSLPTEYLRWLVEGFEVEPEGNLTPALRKYRRDLNRDLVSAAEDVLADREES